MGAFAQINPIWLYGPYNPSQVSAGSQPDPYIFFLEGSLRMMPNWETDFLGHTISWNILIPGVILPGIMFNLIYAYPTLEAWITKDKAYHNLLQRPRDVPVRTALGVMAIVFYGILYLAGQNDLLAYTFHWSLQATTWTMRFLLILAPPLAFYITKRWALGLQHHDAELLHHGIETGIIRRLPSGEYVEITRPLPAAKAQVLAAQLGIEHDAHAAIGSTNGHAATTNGHVASEGPDHEIARPVGLLARTRQALEGFFYERSEPPRPVDEDEPKTLTRP
jgi:ubiquinol-cytochrome c reductase cytochrome b subunit